MNMKRLFSCMLAIMTVIIDSILRIMAFICLIFYIDNIAEKFIDAANNFREAAASFIEII